MPYLKHALFSALLPLALCQVDDSLESKELNTSQAWGYGFLASVGLIIVALIAEEIVMVVKHYISINSFRLLLNVLYALACGTMVGDVILHSLPQAFNSPDTKVAIVGLLFMLAIFLFILMDRIFKYCGLTAQRWGTVEEILPPPAPLEPEELKEPEPLDLTSVIRTNKTINKKPAPAPAPSNQEQGMTLSDHWDSIAMPQKKLREQLREIKKKQAESRAQKYQQQLNQELVPNVEQNKEGELKKSTVGLSSKQNLVEGEANQNQENKQKTSSKDIEAVRSFTTYQRRTELKKSTALIKEARKREEDLQKEREREENEDCFDRLKGKRMEGYLEIFMSLLHNFFDGFAIGVGFGTRDANEYVPILVAVFTHAIPRELGDIAILMKAGFDDCQTKVLAGLPKVTILIGCAVGLGLQTTSQAAKQYILTIVAGTFMYLAADIWKSLFLSNKKCNNIVQFIVLAFGVGIQYLLLLVEH